MAEDNKKTEQTPNRDVIDQLVGTPPTPPASNKDIDLDTKVTYVVNGKEVTRPVKEWLTLASKGEGAEQKLQEAAEARRVADAVDTLYREGATPEQKREAQTILFKRSGMSDDLINELLNAAPTNDGTGPKEPAVDTTKVTELERRVGDREFQQNELYESQLDQAIETVLSNDPDLGLYLNGESGEVPEGRKTELTKVFRAKAIEAMNLRTAAGERFSPRWIGDAVRNSKGEVLKHAQQVIGTSPRLGRSPETMLGSDVAALLKENKMPRKGAPREDFLKYAQGDLMKAAWDAGFTPKSR